VYPLLKTTVGSLINVLTELIVLELPLTLKLPVIVTSEESVNEGLNNAPVSVPDAIFCAVMVESVI